MFPGRRHATFLPLLLATVLAVGVKRVEAQKAPASQASQKGRRVQQITEVAPPDTAKAADSVSTIVRIVDFIAHPTLQIVTWPLQHVLTPGVEFLTYPVQPPIRYFLEENVIDRTTGLFQFGSNRDFSIYPTISLASGTASRTGATMRHESPFGRESERSVTYFQYYVNGDYRIRTLFEMEEFLSTPLQAKFAFGLSRFENTPIYQPEVNTPYYHANRSESYESQLDFPLWNSFYLRSGFTLRNNRLQDSPPAIAGQPGNRLTSDFFRDETGAIDPTGSYRGLNQDFLDRVWLLGLVRDTRTNENIPLDGSRLEAGWYFHDADLSHDFYEWRGRYTAYFKLGAERYEITAREELQRGGTKIDRFIRRIEYQRLRQTIFSRKVLVLHAYGGQSYELPGNSMPLYGLQALGNGTPLRAYTGSRYRHYAVAATSAEYRFPILRIMDGMFFNEYGVFGRSMDRLDFADNLRNSWGFGVRVREPDMFLFRVEVAFHGVSGAVFNANADTPF